MIPALRGYQIGLVATLREQFRFYRRIVSVLPTGGGKTVVAGHLASSAVAKGKRTLFLAHRVELIDQASRKLDDFGVAHGVIKAGHQRQDPSAPMQVASVQTLARRLEKMAAAASDDQAALWGAHRPSWLQGFDLVIVDECHHVCASQYLAILEAFPQAHVLGLTATPYRLDGQGLGEHFEHLVVGAHVPELIESGFLVRTRTYAPSSKLVREHLVKMRSRAGEFAIDAAARVMNATGPIEEIVNTWREKAAGRITVGFACTVAHAEALADAFASAGVPAAAIDGATDAHRRDEVLEQLARGELQVVFNCQLLTEGWDLPVCSCVIEARPTKSRALWRQMVGRGMRSSPGKSDCIVLDHADNAHRFGIPDEADHYDLDRDLVHEDPKTDDCPHCGVVLPLIEIRGGRRRMPEVCPECACVIGEPGGHGSRGGRSGESWVERDEHELREFAGLTESDREGVYRDYLAKARAKGYADGWAAHRYKERFGRWPLRGWAEAVPA